MTHWKSMMGKEYLGAWDLEGRDFTLEIADVKAVDLPGTATIKAGRRPVLSFKGTDKKMVLNTTNGTVIAGMYGTSAADWIGKRITLFGTTTRGTGGSLIDCVRVKPMIPPPKGAKATDDAERPCEREPGEEG